MKKIVFLLVCFMVLILSCCSNNQVKTKLLFESGSVYTFYVGSQSSNSKIIVASKTDALSYKQSLNDICGESTTCKSIDSVEKIIKNYDAKLLHSEKCSNVYSYYFYSKALSNYVYVNGQKVNLHIAINYQSEKNTVVVGSPIIFGGF